MMMQEKDELSRVLERIGDEVKDVVPTMNVSVPETIPESKKELISDEELKGVYDEIMGNLREDRNLIDELLHNFMEMVINGGDCSNSSKEALVNLVNAKVDTNDKMTKIADLKTRIKLKSPDTFKPYLSAKQDNKTTINIGGDKRQLIEAISKMAKVKKDEQ
jgi:hypothetical protein